MTASTTVGAGGSPAPTTGDVNQTVSGYMWWCKSQSRNPRFRGVDRDDVFSTAMQALWDAHDWVEAKGFPPADLLKVAARILRRGIFDLRKRRSPRLAAWPRNAEGEEREYPDSQAFEPHAWLAALEAMPTLLAAPCVVCRTTAGAVHKGCTRPNRTRGMCHNCYMQSRYVSRSGPPV